MRYGQFQQKTQCFKMKKKGKIAENIIMFQRFAPTQVLDLSFSDGANKVEKPNAKKQKTQTTIENTKPEL